MDYLNYKNVLAHHGIKGQKWGVRNGPPYPLNPDKHSAAEKKAGSKSWSKERNKKSKHIKRMATKEELAEADRKYAEAKDWLDKYKFDESIEKAMREINPNFSSGNPAFTTNCVNCSLAYEARRRGLSFTSKANPDGEIVNKALSDAFGPKGRITSFIHNRGAKDDTAGTLKYIEETNAKMAEGGVGSRGIAFMYFKGSFAMGHVVAYEVIANKDGSPLPVIMDSQSNAKYLMNDLADTSDIGFVRTDNLSFNEQKVRKYVGANS